MSNRSKQHLPLPAILICLAAVAFSASPASALDVDAGPDGASLFARPQELLAAEYAVFGGMASDTWQVGDIGGGGVGGVRIDDDDRGRPRDLGKKFTAGLLSLVLPGAGQYYNGDRSKAAVFLGAEAAVWTTYIVFNEQGEGYEEDYKQYAESYAGVSGEHDADYWSALSSYLDGDAYNEALLRDARANGIDDPTLLAPEDVWQWRNQDYQYDYRSIRADAKRSYDRRDFMTAFAVINRIVSVVDAVRSAGDDLLSAEVAGFRVDVDLASSLANPGTGCVISRNF